MLKRIFHQGDGDQVEISFERSQLESRLAQIASDMPEVSWDALIKSDGLLVSKFPATLDISDDRLAAMSVAAQVLGERITHELKHGAFQHSFIVGAEYSLLVVALNKNYSLALGMRSGNSLDSVLKRLRPNQDLLLRLFK